MKTFASMTTMVLAAAWMGTAEAKPVQVEMKTNHGKIVLALDAKKAPNTVKNFVAYVKAGHYDGTIFHRVIDGFMIQGGGFSKDFKQKATKPPVKNEADNGLKNLRGTVAMARTSDPHSATAQFFINVKDNAFLDFKSKDSRGWGYTVFGKVTSGMDVVDKIKAIKTTRKGPFPSDVPVTDVIIEKARVL